VPSFDEGKGMNIPSPVLVVSTVGGIDQEKSNDAAGPAELLNGGEHFDNVDAEDDLPRNHSGTRRRLLQKVDDSETQPCLLSSVSVQP
jgi:hypothetical protein